MNRHAVKLILVIAVLVLAGNAWAQSHAVNVGFKFAAQGKMFAAGSYTVALGQNGEPVLTGPGGVTIELKRVRAINKESKKTQLAFDRIGETMFISEVWIPGKGSWKVAIVDPSEEHKVVAESDAK